MRTWPLVAILSALSAPAYAFDSDGDGIEDPSDAYPCRPEARASAFAPARGVYGMLLFEDQWPAAGDLDFNDAVIAYNYELRLDGQGMVTSLRATLAPIALGGDFANGLGLHLPAPSSAVASVVLTVGTKPAVAVSATGQDAELTVYLADNLRALFGGASGPVNSLPGRAGQTGEALELEVVFAQPVSLLASEAPFDLFLFRSGDRGHQIHRPTFSGTADMNGALLGSADDRSSASKFFVEQNGLPFVLDLSVDAEYPAEGESISSLFPDIMGFATSGGAANADFYLSTVALAHAYADDAGQSAGRPAAPAHAVDRSCILQASFAVPGASQTFTVPAGVTEITVRMWGAGGASTGRSGGAGGYTSGVVSVTPGEILGVDVGGPDYGPLPSAYSTYGTGGGRSALWRGTQTGELLVAGGGGEGRSYRGGAGGGTNGQSGEGGPSTQPGYGQTSYSTGGGSQTRGGVAGCATSWSGHNRCGVNGARIHGSRGHNNSLHQGGFGGGGFYGGASGGATAYSGAGGGGGSGYVSPAVVSGSTVGGNRAVAGNTSDPERGAAGDPDQPGLVLINW